MESINHNFIGPGNAVRIQSFIEKEFPPLTWNILSLKMMKLLVKKKINTFNLDATSEFDNEILQEINQLLLERNNKGLQI